MVLIFLIYRVYRSSDAYIICNYEYPPFGGGWVINASLAMELAKQHEVTILTSQGLSLLSEIVEYGVRIIREPVFLEKKRLWLV